MENCSVRRISLGCIKIRDVSKIGPASGLWLTRSIGILHRSGDQSSGLIYLMFSKQLTGGNKFIWALKYSSRPPADSRKRPGRHSAARPPLALLEIQSHPLLWIWIYNTHLPNRVNINAHWIDNRIEKTVSKPVSSDYLSKEVGTEMKNGSTWGKTCTYCI